MMDWSVCVVCQQTTHEPLRYPLNAHGAYKSAPAAYAAFLGNVTHFRQLNCLPVALIFGADIDLNEFIRDRAQWHKSCHAQFNANRLARARKRKRAETPESSISGNRHRRLRQSFDKTSCIFCSKQDGLLHEFRTLGPMTMLDLWPEIYKRAMY